MTVGHSQIYVVVYVLHVIIVIFQLEPENGWGSNDGGTDDGDRSVVHSTHLSTSSQ